MISSVVFGGLFLIIAVYYYFAASTSKALPPGPRGLPILGNALQLLASGLPLEQVFMKWSRSYGDVMLVTVPRRKIIVLNTYKAAKDLLDKRSSIYSDRPPMIMHMELAGWTRLTPGLPYGERIRTHRRIVISTLNPKAVQQYTELQKTGALRLIEALSKTPDEFSQHLKNYAASTIIKLVYGPQKTEEILKLAYEAMESSNALGFPGATAVDLLPVLKHIPIWMPFISFRREAEKVRMIVQQAHEMPYNLVKDALKSGTAGSSLVADNLRARGGLENVSEEEEEDIKCAAATLLAGALDTTISALNEFVLAMVLNSEVYRKAQTEIDTVVGDSRLPSFEDMDSLPYLDAIIREIHRWGAAFTLSIPHKLIQDDIYEGHLLPSGALVAPNVYAMFRACPDPESFIPQRYIDGTSLGDVPEDPRELVFGFGRRRCPGEHLANRTIFIALAQITALFDISPRKDSSGLSCPPLAEFTSGDAVRHPKPFKCCITIRPSRREFLSSYTS
ncbi:cytochrome P450 [Desarmillaria tabescens]|uniref:Cytochrome P450 n=1 Tax=Armillaria tabescens TaxID=1929756 RepID=A0AA39TTZ0_ARMTA|nr:cytochrome P450 [Desarmillaria tabescens]KAK0470097.1 cytochrome P450 [Desarmillaria tabescens]